MRIHFERSGGFAGMLIATEVDCESLSPEEAQELKELVEDAGFFEMPAVIESATPGIDRFQYKVTIETKEQLHTVEVGEAAAPEALRPLLQRLTNLARRSQE